MIRPIPTTIAEIREAVLKFKNEAPPFTGDRQADLGTSVARMMLASVISYIDTGDFKNGMVDEFMKMVNEKTKSGRN